MVRVHVDGNGVVEPGVYITTQSYPISTSSGTARMLVTVRGVQ
jgi:hypothetical protein